jgi:hypothetical protein
MKTTGCVARGVRTRLNNERGTWLEGQVKGLIQWVLEEGCGSSWGGSGTSEGKVEKGQS